MGRHARLRRAGADPRRARRRARRRVRARRRRVLHAHRPRPVRARRTTTRSCGRTSPTRRRGRRPSGPSCPPSSTPSCGARSPRIPRSGTLRRATSAAPSAPPRASAATPGRSGWSRAAPPRPRRRSPRAAACRCPAAGRRRRPVIAAAALTVVAAVAAFVLLDGGERRAAGERRAQSAADRHAAAGAGRRHCFRARREDDPRTSATARATRRRDGHVWVVSSSRARITSIDVESGDHGRAPAVRRQRRGRHRARRGHALGRRPRARGGAWASARGRGECIRHIETAAAADPGWPPARAGCGWSGGRRRAARPSLCATTATAASRAAADRSSPTASRASRSAAGTSGWRSSCERRVMRIAPGGEPEHGAWLTAPRPTLAYGAGYVWASVAGRRLRRPHRPAQQARDRRRIAGSTARSSSPSPTAASSWRATPTHSVVVLDPKTGKPVGEPLPVAPQSLRRRRGGRPRVGHRAWAGTR